MSYEYIKNTGGLGGEDVVYPYESIIKITQSIEDLIAETDRAIGSTSDQEIINQLQEAKQYAVRKRSEVKNCIGQVIAEKHLSIKCREQNAVGVLKDAKTALLNALSTANIEEDVSDIEAEIEENVHDFEYMQIPVLRAVTMQPVQQESSGLSGIAIGGIVITILGAGAVAAYMYFRSRNKEEEPLEIG